MLEAAGGDERAFERLVSIFQKPVIGTIYRYLGDAALAEDLAQDVFLKIYQARKRYKPLARFETWLHRIVYNVVVNEAQSRSKRREFSLDNLRERGWEERGGGEEPLHRMEENELKGKVREAVTELPPNQRMVLILNKYRDMSYQDIAETLETSVEAVKSMLYRARERVRLKLARYVRIEVCDELDV